MAAEPAAGKTWLGLWLAWQVIAEGGIVVWTDEELGVDTVGERLLALGANPDLVEANLVYLAYPGWKAERADVNSWEALMKAAKPSLVVIDTATDALAEAGVDENSGAEVTKWVKAYCEPPRRIGAAVLVLDHVPKADKGAGRGYAVGSRAKKAKAKIQYSLSKQEDYTVDTVGMVRIKLDKNSFGLPIETKRSFRFGGEVSDSGQQRFIIKPASFVESAEADGAFEPSAEEKKSARMKQVRLAVIDALQLAKTPMGKTEIRQAVSVGSNVERSTAVAELVASGDKRLKIEGTDARPKYAWVEA
jgi:hypothetical protein